MQTIKDWLQTPEISELRKQPLYEIVETGFHREKVVPIFVNKEILFSPANGVILYAKHLKTQDEILEVHGAPFTLKELIRKDIYDSEFIVIGIFMTYLDIHVNYMASGGYIRFEKLQELKITNLSMTKVEVELLQKDITRPDPDNMDYLFYNERMLNTIYDNEIGQEYYIVQIADAEVGSIVPFNEQDKFVPQGEAFSAVRFGSQVDVIVPIKKDKTYEIMVSDKVGWHVDAAKDPLIKITKDIAKSDSLVTNDAKSWEAWDAAHKGHGGGGGSGSESGQWSKSKSAAASKHTKPDANHPYKIKMIVPGYDPMHSKDCFSKSELESTFIGRIPKGTQFEIVDMLKGETVATGTAGQGHAWK